MQKGIWSWFKMFLISFFMDKTRFTVSLPKKRVIVILKLCFYCTNKSLVALSDMILRSPCY